MPAPTPDRRRGSRSVHRTGGDRLGEGPRRDVLTSWHAVADEGDAAGDIAAVIGRRLGLTTASLPQEDFGPLGPVFATDRPASSSHTRTALGWTPTHPGLLAELENIQP
ncbi:hypothetical protein [Kitasatospora terrestris]|uniref:Reductase n=1 Tax=Kitasatospora terrestris TaxID=258051 RepID=A0ABP9EL80_9ACTN